MKYDGLRIVAKVPCPACSGTGTRSGHPDLEGSLDPAARCPTCAGDGGSEQDLLLKGEPYFLIRGKDLLAVGAVHGYLGLLVTAALAAGVPPAADLMASLNETLAAITTWQQNNPGLVKLPD